jgi:hypothetical protein
MPITTPITTLYQPLADLLADVVADLTDNGQYLPDRQYVSHNAPAWDCELLTTHWERVALQDRADAPGSHRARVAGTRQEIACIITYIICVPTGDDANPLPDTALLNDSAETIVNAGWVTYQGLTCRFFNKTLLTDQRFRITHFGQLQPLGPQGGMGGWRLQLTVELS